MTDLQLRPFRKSDLAPVLDLWDAAWHAQLAEEHHAILDRRIFERRLLVDELPEHPVIVAETDTRLAGFLILHLADHYISHLAVAPDLGRAGVGRHLAAFARACLGVPAKLSVLQVNTGARQFWERLGARQTGATTSPSGRPAFAYTLD